MKMYSVNWNCKDYHWVFMTCVADSKDAAIVKFKARFQEYKETFQEHDETDLEGEGFKFFTDVVDPWNISSEIKETEIDGVSMTIMEE